MAVGWWLAITGMFLAAVAVIGWTFEYFRGEHTV
jgi:cytochrome c oxidase subunit IV